MSDEACLYAAMRSPKASHDRLLRELVAPVAREIRHRAELDSFFFVRYNVPEWELRFRILGRPAWIEREVREKVERAIEPFVRDGAIEQVVFGEYDREFERYGGTEGMTLAETIFLHDSAACLDLLEVEASGSLAKSRREYSLVFTERLLDMLRLRGEARMAVYRSGFEWALEDGTWTAEDTPRLEAQYAAIREGLHDLFFGEIAADPAALWGGVEPARIAETCLGALRPVIDSLLAAHAAGRIPQSLTHLAWSYAHMHCNRLGIDVVPEAILRYFMHRLHEDFDET